MPSRQISDEIKSLASLYQHHVLSTRTREVKLLGRKCSPQVLYTFLGFELKMGRKRVTCPDMTTARYLRVFGEVGLATIQIPYDPTQTARLLPPLERSLNRIKELLMMEGLDEKQHQRRLRDVYGRIRKRLLAAAD